MTDYFDKPTVGRDDDGNMVIILKDGAAASYKHGKWQPGLLWSGRTIMEFYQVNDDSTLEAVLAQADSALKTSRLPRDRW